MSELKTLEDFKKDGSSWIIGVSQGDISLDAFKKGYEKREVFPLEALREEAIRWIQSDDSFKKMDIDTWREFFNITEEDLK